MAYEAHYDAVIPYCNVTLDEIHPLTQDTIFSRSPVGVKRTGIFIGGRDFHLAIDMLNAARAAMVPPFAVSVLADPSGAITTAAAMVALVEHWLKRIDGRDLKGRLVHVLGGTGPVGNCVGLLAAMCGAEVYLVSKRGAREAQASADICNARYGVSLRGAAGGEPGEIAAILDTSEVLFNAAKAGVQLIDQTMLAGAQRLLVAADANAVPPSGIEGIGAKDLGLPIETAGGVVRGLGALAIGDVKYKVHTGLLAAMHEASEPLFLAHEEAFALARRLVG